MQIKISVIGLSYNGRDILPNFIESIYASSLHKKEVEIIIVDNASTDGTVDLIRSSYPDVKIIQRTENIGSGAHNDALKVAKGEYFLFTDSDMKFDRHCLENFYKTAKELGKGVILSPVLYEYYRKNKPMPSYSVTSRSFYSVFVKPKHTKFILREIPMAGFIFIHRDTTKKLGYIFDNDYFLYAEDFDLCLRIRLLGLKLYLCPNAIMYNVLPSKTTTKYIGQAKLTYYLERNLLMTFLKICSIRTILIYLPYVIFVRFVALLMDLFRFRFIVLLIRIKAYSWVIFNIKKVMAKRRITQKMRVKKDRYIFSMVDESYFIKSKLGLFRDNN